MVTCRRPQGSVLDFLEAVYAGGRGHWGPDRRRILGDISDSRLVSHEYGLLVLAPVGTCQRLQSVVPAGALGGSKLAVMCVLVSKWTPRTLG